MAPPALWSTRAVPDRSHAHVVASLARVDEWVEVLYPVADGTDITEWPWELDEFVGAVLAMHTTKELTDGWRSTKGPGLVLRVPDSARLKEMPKAAKLLSRFGRLQEAGPRRNRKLDYWALANVRLGCWDDELGTVLFPSPDRSRIRRAATDPRGVVAAGFTLGCYDWIGLPFAYRANPSMDGGTVAFKRDPFILHDYARSRRVIASQEANPTTSPTVHRLLWGTPVDAKLAAWQMAQWETPALGLPSRVAAALFRTVRLELPPDEWEPSQGPLIWLIDDTNETLAAGRRSQYHVGQESAPVEQSPSMARSTVWEVMPHAAYYLPFVSSTTELHAQSYVLYCDVLLFLTVLDGSERILDTIVKWGVTATPFVDRWAWRSRIHLQLEEWQSIEDVLRWSVSPESDATHHGDYLAESLSKWSRKIVSWEDFLPERIDVGLLSGKDLEVVRTIRPAGDLLGPDLPPELCVAQKSILNELIVRVGQVAAWPDSAEVIAQFPAISSEKANEMIEQVSNVFLAPARAGVNVSPNLLVFPELAIPQNEVGSLRDLVRTERKSAVAGLYWRTLKPAFRPPAGFTPSWAYFVNEAELIFPVGDDRGPPSVRWFRVRKPVPAHIENGLARALSRKSVFTKWHMMQGQRWYRFVHPEWGDFTVAICADLIDSAPWRALRGELLHLLMVAFNKDVDLFDALTWVRAYETYVNVASVNHGQFGGSFIWTPRRTHGRELARLRGQRLALTADVRLPVKNLLRAQKKGVAKAIVRAASKWESKQSAPTKFKAPPPGFRRKV